MKDHHSRGGLARAAKLSPERKSEIARLAANKRWGAKSKRFADDRSEVQRAALHFMRRGQMTPSQAALLAGVDRATMRRWARDAKIDVDKRIWNRLQSLWRARIMGFRRAPRARKAPDDATIISDDERPF